MTAPPVRRAVSADIPAMAGIINDWIDATDWHPRDITREGLEAAIAEAFPTRTIWVVGEEAVAYLSMDETTAKVGGLYCRAPGQGHGRALMDTAKAGRDHLWLTTHVPNTGAHRFYQREGFAFAGEAFTEGDDPVPLYRMEWRA